MDKVRFEISGPLGILTLANPPLNLFSGELIEDLRASVDQVKQTPLRALLVRAEGNIFSGGADVGIFKGRTSMEARERFTGHLRLIADLEELPFPTVAAVQGLCLAAGLEAFALACDLIWAAASARFGQVEASIGTTTLLGGVQRLAERAGPSRAREIIYTADQYDARFATRSSLAGASNHLFAQMPKRPETWRLGPTKGPKRPPTLGRGPACLTAHEPSSTLPLKRAYKIPIHYASKFSTEPS